MTAPAEQLRQALQWHQQGQLDTAEQAYRALLQQAPHTAEALHLLGLLLRQRGRESEALPLLRRACKIQAAEPRYRLSLGDALAAQGQWREAREQFAALLRSAPADIELRWRYGQACLHSGAIAEAVEYFRQLLAIVPERADVRLHLGIALQRTGDGIGAAAAYREILERDPAHADALNNLGSLLLDQGEWEQAQQCFRDALRARPDFVLAHNNLGNCLRHQGRYEEAIAAYQLALAAAPDYADAWNHSGLCYLEAGRFDEAAHSFAKALQLQPRQPLFGNHLGNVFRARQQWDEALAQYEQVLRWDARCTEARYNLATLLQQLAPHQPAAQQQKMEERALAELERVVREWPAAGEPLSALLHLRRQRCDWEQLPALATRARQLLQEGAALSPFSMITLQDSTAAEQLTVARRWARRYAGAPAVSRAARMRDGRLRIGYLSADLHDHPTAWLLARVIELHDRERFDVYAYSYGPDDGSAMRARLVQAFDVFRDLRHCSDQQAAQQIAADGIDVLLDLKGYTRDARPAIAARRPAPLQVSYLGYPGTMGAPFIDYLVADPFIAPAEHAADFSEALALLPVCYQPNDNRRERLPSPPRAQLQLPEAGLVLAAFHQPYKLNAPLFELWCRLLSALPDAVLWLLEGSAAQRANLLRAARKAGIAPQRLVFAPKQHHDLHLARLACADLVLDSFPVNGHTSTSDALWAGVPVVTCAGDTLITRVAGSLLRAVGLEELVASDFAGYEAVVLALGRDAQHRAQLRERLQQGRAREYLFDSEAYTRDWERLLAAMWQRSCAGLPPATLGPLERC